MSGQRSPEASRAHSLIVKLFPSVELWNRIHVSVGPPVFLRP
jgi:hypothetical protein